MKHPEAEIIAHVERDNELWAVSVDFHGQFSAWVIRRNGEMMF
jgi:hypothetical protein